MNILKIISMPFILCLSACSLFSSHAEFIPKNSMLKDAVIGVPYFTRVDILGGVIGKACSSCEYMPGRITPNNVGLSLRNCQLSEKETKDMLPKDSNNYNCIEIYGIPTKTGVIKINISGGTYGSMITPATEFSKVYMLNVKAAE